MIERSFDPETGIIRVISSGQWSRADIDEHYSKLRDMIADRNLSQQPVRVLSDVRGAERQTPWNEDYIKSKMEEVYGPWDRVVILAGSVEDRTHIRTLLSGTEIWCFCSELAAEQYLLLDDRGVHAA